MSGGRLDTVRTLCVIFCEQYLDIFFLVCGCRDTFFSSLVGLTGQERGYRLGECEVFGCTTILVGAWTKKSRHKRGNGEVRGDRL